MNIAALIEQTNTAGIMLALNGDRLTWSASKEPSPELLTQLREGKAQIIEHLRQQQYAWLDRVAALLNTNACTLLEHGLIDLDDLVEQYQKHPRFAARLIETSEAWQKVSLVRDEVRAPYAWEVRTECVPTEGNKGNNPTRGNEAAKLAAQHHDRDAPEWITARDAFHGHALGHCKDCYPPAGRYCPTGLDLLALYRRATK